MNANSLTIYAQRFGIPDGEPCGAGKSGLTPLSPLHPAVVMSPGAYAMRREIEAFQRSHFKGYTTQNLRELDVITERDLSPCSLGNPILAILDRDRWEPEGKFPTNQDAFPSRPLYVCPGELVGKTHDVNCAYNLVTYFTILALRTGGCAWLAIYEPSQNLLKWMKVNFPSLYRGCK